MTNSKRKFQLIAIKQKQGFALLIGVLISAILISISYSLFSITLKQTTLSVAGKDSQIAFYAADTGIECAYYADNKIDPSPFVGITVNNGNIVLSSLSTFPKPKCNGGDITISSLPNDTVNGYSAVVSTFTLNGFPSTNKSCAVVKVYKYLINNNIKTRIESLGYNTCNVNDPQRLERGIQVNYPF